MYVHLLLTPRYFWCCDMPATSSMAAIIAADLSHDCSDEKPKEQPKQQQQQQQQAPKETQQQKPAQQPAVSFPIGLLSKSHLSKDWQSVASGTSLTAGILAGLCRASSQADAAWQRKQLMAVYHKQMLCNCCLSVAAGQVIVHCNLTCRCVPIAAFSVASRSVQLGLWLVAIVTCTLGPPDCQPDVVSVVCAG